jgi:hypothetical protein
MSWIDCPKRGRHLYVKRSLLQSGNNTICCSFVGRIRNVVRGRQPQERLYIAVVRVKAKRIPKEHQHIYPGLCDSASNLLIAPKGPLSKRKTGTFKVAAMTSAV